jgi:cytochrome c peroxidase
MRPPLRPWILSLVAAVLALAGAGLEAVPAAGRAGRLPNNLPAPNPDGEARTISTLGGVDLDNPFFRSLGTNGRACVTCHAPAEGWSIVPEHVRARFDVTEGQDPLFRPVDGSTSPLADVSTVAARRQAYALLLERGVIRIGLPMPAGAEFTLEAVDDPHGHASAAELSLFRRPLPATNLRFLSTVMWDGRETFEGQSMAFNLGHQADSATLGHAQAARPLTAEEQAAIVEFETSLYTAQWWDRDAGQMRSDARGGPRVLVRQEVAGAAPFAFTLFDRWTSGAGRRAAARAAVARGEALFNTRPFGRGFTCSACHDTQNAGSDSARRFFDLGLSDEARRPPDLPLYTLRCTTSGQLVRTTDPGRALVTGRCADLNRFKIPTLRGLAGRRPYFHNGSAATLHDVVAVYEQRFGIGLSQAETADLVAFLRAL